MVDSALKRLATLGKDSGGWILAALERAQESSEEFHTDPGWFHPSDLGSECDAFLAFRFLGAPGVSTVTPRMRRIFDNGHARDVQLKRDMKRSGASLITKEEERKISIPIYRIRGELDDLIQHPITGQKYVIDYKTMNKDEWEKLDAVKSSHHKQIMVYEFGKEVYKGYVIYENKNTQELKAKKADFDNNIWAEIIARLEGIISNLEQEFVVRNPVNCSSCPFFSNGVCTGNQIRELKLKSGLYA